MDCTSGTINHAEVVPLRNLKPFLMRAFMVDENSGTEIIKLNDELDDSEDLTDDELLLIHGVGYHDA